MACAHCGGSALPEWRDLLCSTAAPPPCSCLHECSCKALVSEPHLQGEIPPTATEVTLLLWSGGADAPRPIALRR